MFEQAAIAVQDEQGYAQLHALIDAAFDARDVEVFLNRVKQGEAADSRLRGDSEARVAGQGSDRRCTQALPVSDQGLTRERYLRLVEAVPLELRQRYLKAYAYY